jgi:hypothetical protein
MTSLAPLHSPLGVKGVYVMAHRLPLPPREPVGAGLGADDEGDEEAGAGAGADDSLAGAEGLGAGAEVTTAGAEVGAGASDEVKGQYTTTLVSVTVVTTAGAV